MLFRNATGGAVPPDHRDEGFHKLVTDRVSLIDRVQASIKLIEIAQGQPATPDAELPTVLDDVKPLHAQASAALDACQASLGAALQF